MRISPYEYQVSQLPSQFKSLGDGSFLYVANVSEVRATEKGAEMRGLFSLLNRPEEITLNGKTYALSIEGDIIPSARPTSIITLDHDIEKKEGNTFLWWSILLVVLSLLGLRIFLKSMMATKKRKMATKNLLAELRNAKVRQDFENLYLRENISLLSSTTRPLGNPFLKKIEDNLYVRYWDNELLKDLKVNGATSSGIRNPILCPLWSFRSFRLGPPKYSHF